MGSPARPSRAGISLGTAKLHLHHVYEKVKLNGRVALLRFMTTAARAIVPPHGTAK